MTDADTLARCRGFRAERRAYGVLIPAEEVQAHEACGWRLVDDLADAGQAAPAVALMRPPADLERAS